MKIFVKTTSISISYMEVHIMNNIDFIKGVGVGVIARATIGMAAAPFTKKKCTKTFAGKVMKTAGEILENVTQVLGM